MCKQTRRTWYSGLISCVLMRLLNRRNIDCLQCAEHTTADSVSSKQAVATVHMRQAVEHYQLHEVTHALPRVKIDAMPQTYESGGAERPSDMSSDRCNCGSISAANSIWAEADGNTATSSGGWYVQDCHPHVHQSAVQQTQLSPALTSDTDLRVGPV